MDNKEELGEKRELRRIGGEVRLEKAGGGKNRKGLRKKRREKERRRETKGR